MLQQLDIHVILPVKFNFTDRQKLVQEGFMYISQTVVGLMSIRHQLLSLRILAHYLAPATFSFRDVKATQSFLLEALGWTDRLFVPCRGASLTMRQQLAKALNFHCQEGFGLRMRLELGADERVRTMKGVRACRPPRAAGGAFSSTIIILLVFTLLWFLTSWSSLFSFYKVIMEDFL